jgi:hypothetical protein
LLKVTQRGVIEKFVVGLIFGISVFPLAGAAILEPPNPLVNINLIFDQCLEKMKQMDAALLKATPRKICGKCQSNSFPY